MARVVAALLLVFVDPGSACTAAAIDGQASTVGSAFVTENTDADDTDFRLVFVPPQDHAENSTRPLYELMDSYPRYVGYGSAAAYHPELGQKVSKVVGHIPQVHHTFGYYESDNALMNDQGLGITESSCGANLLNKLKGSDDPRKVPEGLIDAMTMMQLVLERCATARCAVDLIGQLAEDFGYLPDGGPPMLAAAAAGKPPAGEVDGRRTYDDVGEAYAVADASGEAWIVNVIGGVEGVVRSVWTAQRVPKGHAAFVANAFTIGELPSEPNENFRFPKEIFQAAISAGLWDGKGKLNWSDVFAPDPTKLVTGGSPPVPSYSALRRWRLMNLVAPSVNMSYEMDQRRYPFSVQVDKLLTHRDIMDLMSDHYGGTEFDLTQGVLAGPYQTPFRVEGGPSSGDAARGISMLRTSYGIIAETGPQGSVAWYCMDTPATSVYVPFDARAGDGIAQSYMRGNSQKFDRSSAWWAFDFVNNWMQLNYKGMSEEDVLPRRKAWQDRIDSQRGDLNSKDVAEVSKWQVDIQEALLADWWDLADHLVVKWNDMRHQGGASIMSPTGGTAYGYPEWWTNMIGFNHDFRPIWVERSTTVPQGCGAVAPTFDIPDTWDALTQTWRSSRVESTLGGNVQVELLAQPVVWSPSSAIPAVAAGVVLFASGFFLGQTRSLPQATAESLLG